MKQKEAREIDFPIYNPLIHKCSDMVLVKHDGEMVQAMVLDDIGHVLLNPMTPRIVIKVK